MSVEGNASAPGTRFTVGRVIATTFSVLFGNIIRFVAIILIIGVPVLGFTVGGSMLLAADMTTTGSGINFKFGAATGFEGAFVIVGALLFGLGYLLIVSALIHGTLQSLAGRPVSISGCLSAGLSALPRVFLASLVLIISGILIAFVAMLLFSMLLSVFLAGILIINLALSLLVLMVFARILLFIPAIMVERAGVMESFGRSQELTQEHRWGIFGILLMIAVANWVGPFGAAALSVISPVASDAFNVAFGVFFIALVSVLIGVAFHVLRTGKEGAPVSEVAKVFD